MSEAIKKRSRASRFQLLTTVSSFALLALANGAEPAMAAQSGSEPALWIEMGVHSDRVQDSPDGFAMPFGNLIPPGGLTGPLTGGLNLSRSPSEDAMFTFRPDGSNWVFSAAVTYGRSRGKGGAVHQTQALPTTSVSYYKHYFPSTPVFNRTVTYPAKVTADRIDADTAASESHLMVDFSVGKDVGLGLFGRGGTSTLSAGVRVAQLNTVINIGRFSAITGAHTSTISSSTPTCCSGYIKIIDNRNQIWQKLSGSSRSWHRFSGVGPSISWTASAPLVGHSQQSELSLDWGINAALLFGKQKNKAQHETSSVTSCYVGGCGTGSPHKDTSQTQSTKTVTVPNLGGFAGVSYRVGEIKASFGYRVDYFFHAIDTGISGQRAATRSFQGPFASISVGVSD